MPLFGSSSKQSIALTSHTKLKPAGSWSGSAEIAPPPSATLGTDEPDTSIPAPMQLFTPAEEPIILDIQTTSGAVLGGDAQAELEFQPTEDAAFALIQTIQTPHGNIYDCTLPRATPPPAATLTPGPTDMSLRFPIHPMVVGRNQPAGGTLGVEEMVGGFVGDIVFKRVLQVVKSPFDKVLLETIRRFEDEPRVLAFRDSFQPLEGFESWRALLPPGEERRVLLFIHGFSSSTEGSSGAAFLPQLGAGYDAVLSYDHPTASRDPLENARDFIAMIPEDLRLSVDIVAHSRGGLVARSLIELLDPLDQFVPQKLITHGSPHNGTQLAEQQRWDRLISIGMTAAEWLTLAAGAAVWIPMTLEYILKAASQGIFALPGIAAMAPNSDFLQKLNAVADPATLAGKLQSRVRYSAVTSAFSVFGVAEPGFREAFKAFAAQAFIDAPNDLVVPTASMNAVDIPNSVVPPDRQLRSAVSHFSYFDDEEVIAFLREQLA
ncbi:MAG: hypothetical protein AAGF95_02435 [Chloroflexota bacterium]